MSKAIAHAEMPLKGIDIEDKNLKVVYLKSGKYLIDREVITVESYSETKVQVKDVSNIRKITENKYVKEYVCGEEKLSVKQYDNQRDELLLKRKYDGYEEEWESLEDEFAYRKFMQLWTPIYNTEQEISEPLLVQFEKTKYDTGCQYIHNAFLNGEDKDFTLFTYEQGQAWLGITRECFEELGMKYKENANYSATNNKKIWSNSTHSCIRYVTGFGGYVFNDSWGNPRVIKGTLEDVRKRYEYDRSTIRKIIIDKYNNHFGCIDAGKFDFDRLRTIISNAQRNLFDIDPKQKSYQAWQRAKDKLKEAQDMINVAYEVKQ